MRSVKMLHSTYFVGHTIRVEYFLSSYCWEWILMSPNNEQKCEVCHLQTFPCFCFVKNMAQCQNPDKDCNKTFLPPWMKLSLRTQISKLFSWKIGFLFPAGIFILLPQPNNSLHVIHNLLVLSKPACPVWL